MSADAGRLEERVIKCCQIEVDRPAEIDDAGIHSARSGKFKASPIWKLATERGIQQRCVVPDQGADFGVRRILSMNSRLGRLIRIDEARHGMTPLRKVAGLDFATCASFGGLGRAIRFSSRSEFASGFRKLPRPVDR